MEKIKKFIDINTSPEVIWSAIINPAKYRLWTSAFHQGSYFEGGWQKGDNIKFLIEDESGHTGGIYSEIAESDHLKHISIKHLGLLHDDIFDDTSQEVKKWVPSFEKYYLEKLDTGNTRFSIDVDADEEYYEHLNQIWDLGLEKLKEVCEKNLGAFLSITVEVIVDAPLNHVWNYWTLAEHIKNWNFASDDWYCPEVTNNFFNGGHFVYTMAAKDASMSFDFSGTYTKIIDYSCIINQLDDGRMMEVKFEELGPSQTRVIERFDAEDENSLKLQRQGWQSILNNFKKFVESNIV